MSAKNTAVNLMILTTFLSFLIYRRANKRPVVPWAQTATLIQAAMFALAAGVVLFYGVYGYFVEAIVRIGFSVYQVLAVLGCIVGVTIIDVVHRARRGVARRDPVGADARRGRSTRCSSSP